MQSQLIHLRGSLNQKRRCLVAWFGTLEGLFQCSISHKVDILFSFLEKKNAQNTCFVSLSVNALLTDFEQQH